MQSLFSAEDDAVYLTPGDDHPQMQLRPPADPAKRCARMIVCALAGALALWAGAAAVAIVFFE